MFKSSHDEDLILYYSTIRNYIWTYIPPGIIIIGIFCNTLSFVVWVRSLVQKRGSSSSYFFACMAIADIIALLFLPIYDHIGKAYYNGLNLRNFSNFTCKFYSFMLAFSLSFSPYILASLALFRMIGTIYPHRYQQICSAKNAKLVILVLIGFTILANIPLIFRSKLINFDGRGLTCWETTYKNNFIRLFFILWPMTVIYITPIFIIFLSNVVIIWRLARKRVQSIGSGRMRRGDHAFSKTITVLITVSLVYFLTMSPTWVYILLHDRGVDWHTAPPVELEWFRLGWAIVSNISLLNSGSNFFIYCLTHPQFVVEVKLCFGVFASRYRSHCQICKRSNAVGVSIINVKELNLGVAGPSGIQAQIQYKTY